MPAFDPAAEAPYYTYSVTTVNVAGLSAVQLCDFNPHRIAVMFGYRAAGANQGYLQPVTRFTGPQGLQIWNTILPLMFSFSQFGGLVQQPWFGSCEPVNGVFTVYQVMYDPHI